MLPSALIFQQRKGRQQEEKRKFKSSSKKKKRKKKKKERKKETRHKSKPAMNGTLDIVDFFFFYNTFFKNPAG